MLIKAILEISYKFLQTPRKTTNLKWHINFLRAVQFVAPFYVQVVTTFALL